MQADLSGRHDSDKLRLLSVDEHEEVTRYRFLETPKASLHPEPEEPRLFKKNL